MTRSIDRNRDGDAADALDNDRSNGGVDVLADDAPDVPPDARDPSFPLEAQSSRESFATRFAKERYGFEPYVPEPVAEFDRAVTERDGDN